MTLITPTARPPATNDGIRPPIETPPRHSSVDDRGPNLTFVFPARPSSPSTAPITQNEAGPSRLNTARLQPTPGLSAKTGSIRRSVDALPIFNFHPAAHTERRMGTLSTPTSPFAHSAISNRPGGHRRGGSEFIGGDGRANGPGLMSSSPTKGDGVLPPPLPMSTVGGPPAGRRGHAHRRSGAISCHDLSFLKKGPEASTSHRAGSAPTTPADPLMSQSGFLRPRSPMMDDRSMEKEDNTTTTAQASSPTRTRVGFSDTLEYIPRPLSTLSSDSSSTFATARGHSISGSISSIASAGTASAPSASNRRSAITSSNKAIPRPHTADAVMFPSKSINSSTTTRKTPVLKRSRSATASVDLISKGRSSFASAAQLAVSDSSDYRIMTSTNSIGSSSQLSHAREAVNVLPSPVPGRNIPTPSPSPGVVLGTTETASVPSPERTQTRSCGKRQRIVKTLAGSILSSRKAKHKSLKQKASARRSLTPPFQLNNMAQHVPVQIPGLDDERIYATLSPSPAPPRPLLVSTASDPMIRTNALPSDLPNASAMIDLDAALGPFNTPDYGPEFGYVSGGGFLAAKRRMHSSGVMGSFSGPGMHYHRRAESAPEMTAFDIDPFHLHRLGSSSTMADVFEEDEEDELGAGGRSRKKAASPAAIANVREEFSLLDGVALAIDAEPMTGRTSGMDVIAPMMSLVDEEGITPAAIDDDDDDDDGSRIGWSLFQQNPPSPVEIVDDDDSPRAPSVTKSSDSTITPPLTGPLLRDAHGLPPFELSMPPPIGSRMTPDTPSIMSSCFPSPEFPSGGFDIPRSLTAASSFTDDHLPTSLIMGEPGPELRISVDDVPSLTSSNSTMTSAYQHHYIPYSIGPGSRGGRSDGHSERTSSICSSAFTPRPESRRSTRTKRSSLVSLSRLVGSASGEKSKLSIEERAQPDGPEKAVKDKKGKRLSRLMHFWKPKDGAKAA